MNLAQKRRHRWQLMNYHCTWGEARPYRIQQHLILVRPFSCPLPFPSRSVQGGGSPKDGSGHPRTRWSVWTYRTHSLGTDTVIVSFTTDSLSSNTRFSWSAGGPTKTFSDVITWFQLALFSISLIARQVMRRAMRLTASLTVGYKWIENMIWRCTRHWWSIIL